eukprot:gene11739-13863_t
MGSGCSKEKPTMVVDVNAHEFEDEDPITRYREELHSAESSPKVMPQYRGPEPAGHIDDVIMGLIKIFVVEAHPSYATPWQMLEQCECTGSGFAISERRILTNAHVVAYHTQLYIRRDGDPTKYEARVLCLGQACDVALLTVDNPAFWNGLPELDFGPLPRIADAVTVVGYPTGGDNISVTKGVVSRVDVHHYTLADGDRLLVVQIDAAINPGNSGGPVFNFEGQVVGIAFCKQNDDGVDNIGYLIPAEIVQLFLKRFDLVGQFQGVCGLGFQYQRLENQYFRQHLSLRDADTGVLVTRVEPLAPLASVLQPDDVLMAINKVPIANDGTVVFRGRERVSLEHVISSSPLESHIDLQIFRKGKEEHIKNTMISVVPKLVPLHHGLDAFPTYIVYGGLVFVPLSYPLIEDLSEGDIGIPLGITKVLEQFKARPNQQIVLLLRILAHSINFGFNSITPALLLQINDVKIDSMQDVKTVIDDVKDNKQHIRFIFENHKTIVLDCEACKQILENAEHGNFANNLKM